jgi:N-acetylglucosamine-6-phosphate deacetylase
MPTVGGPSEFDLYGTKVHLINNRLVNSEGSLAGAHTTMSEGVRRLVERVGISPEEALKMAVTIPGEALGLTTDRLKGMDLGSVVCLTDEMSFLGLLEDVWSMAEV